MIPGETILSGAPDVCDGWGSHEHHKVTFMVMKSAAGYYVGTLCPFCGPYSRETGYWRTEAQASAALDHYRNKGVLPGKRT